MNLQLRRSYSFLTQLLFLAAVFVMVHSEYAWPQSERSAAGSSSKLQSQAEQGDAVAQYNLAISYLRNSSTNGSTNGPSNEDYQAAVKWLGASAAHGNADANSGSGTCTSMARAFPRDYGKAVESYRVRHCRVIHLPKTIWLLYTSTDKACRRTWIGVRMVSGFRANGNQSGPVQPGDGLLPWPRNSPRLQRSGKWFRAAADSGSATRKNSLAVLYYRGLESKLDYAEAARWLRLAARQSVPSAETKPRVFVRARDWPAARFTSLPTLGIHALSRR